MNIVPPSGLIARLTGHAVIAREQTLGGLVVAERDEIEVQGRIYTVQFERHIVHSQREVILTAFDSSGKPVMRWAMNTSAARAYQLRQDDSPPSWEQLEEIALSNLKLELEE